jgi:hypothetical protein
MITPFIVKLKSKKDASSINKLTYYKNMNIYYNCSFGQLLNKLWVNKYCHYPCLIDRSDKFYKWSKRLLTARFTHWFMRKTVGKVFTGG